MPDSRNLPALGTHTELLKRRKLGGFSDSLNNLGLVLELAGLGRDQTQHNSLLAVLGQESQGLEPTASLVIPFKQEVVDLQLSEQDLGNGLVTTRGKVSRSEVSSAQVNGSGHVCRLELQCLVDELDVLSGQLVDVFTSFGGGVSHLLGAQVGQVGVVELDVLASGFGERSDFLLVSLGQVGVELSQVRVVFVVDTGSAAIRTISNRILRESKCDLQSEVRHGRGRNGDLDGRPRVLQVVLDELVVVDLDRFDPLDLADNGQLRRSSFPETNTLASSSKDSSTPLTSSHRRACSP